MPGIPTRMGAKPAAVASVAGRSAPMTPQHGANALTAQNVQASGAVSSTSSAAAWQHQQQQHQQQQLPPHTEQQASASGMVPLSGTAAMHGTLPHVVTATIGRAGADQQQQQQQHQHQQQRLTGSLGGVNPQLPPTSVPPVQHDFVVVDTVDGIKLRVGYEGISIVDSPKSGSGGATKLPPVVHMEDLVFERDLDRTHDRNVKLFRRADSADRKERYAVKELKINSSTEALYVVGAEVGAAFFNRSEYAVRLRNAYLRGGSLFLVMEYMDGRSLSDLLRSLSELGETMPEEVAAFVTHRLLLALQSLHCSGAESESASSSSNSNTSPPSGAASSAAGGVVSSPVAAASCCGGNRPDLHIRTTSLNSNAGSASPGAVGMHGAKRVVHRDVKPSNCLLNSAGAVKLADFGSSGSTDSIGLATFVGTVTYMSPERIHGKGYNTPSDIWSVGALAAECLLGHHPFLGDQAKAKHLQTMEHNRAAVQQLFHKSSGAGAAPPAPSPVAPAASAAAAPTPAASNNGNTLTSPPPVMMTAGAPGTKAASAAAAAHATSSAGGAVGTGSGNNHNAPSAASKGRASGLASGGGGMTHFYELFERVTRCDDFDIGADFSAEARDFVKQCLWQDPDKRPSATELLQHPWVARFNATSGTRSRGNSKVAAPPQKAPPAAAPSANGNSNSSGIDADLLRLRSEGSFVSASSGNSVPCTTTLPSPLSLASETAAPSPEKQKDESSPSAAEIVPIAAADTAAAPAPSKRAMSPTSFAEYVIAVRRRAKEKEMAERAASKKAAAATAAALESTAPAVAAAAAPANVRGHSSEHRSSTSSSTHHDKDGAKERSHHHSHSRSSRSTVSSSGAALQ